MAHLIKVTSETLAKILAGTQTAYLFQARTGYKAGDALVFSDGGHKVGATYRSESDGALGSITEDDAKKLGYADVNELATAWDLEQRNREKGKKFAANPQVTTIVFDTPVDQGSVVKAPKPEPAKKSVSRGPLGRKKATKAKASKKTRAK